MDVNKELKIVYKRVDELVPYEKNPRRNDGAVPKVAESIKRNGFKIPLVVDANNVIVCGHTRHKAAKRLGIEFVPCVIADDLSPEQVDAFRIEENRTHELAIWDDTLLSDELDRLKQLGIDMSNLFAAADDQMEKAKKDEVKPRVQFTEELLEAHNYVVLYFDNEIDWLQAQSIFDIKTVEGYSTKQDGNGKIRKFGVGRVIRGADFLKKMTERVLNGEDKR